MSTAAHDVDRTLDCSGLLCPLPALETQRTLAAMKPGERLEVICTDPASRIDLTALCHSSADRLIEIVVEGEGEGKVLRFRIERR